MVINLPAGHKHWPVELGVKVESLHLVQLVAVVAQVAHFPSQAVTTPFNMKNPSFNLHTPETAV